MKQIKTYCESNNCEYIYIKNVSDEIYNLYFANKNIKTQAILLKRHI